MDYVRYYLGTVFMLAGISGFVLGGAWVWLGATTFLWALLLDLLALQSDYCRPVLRHRQLADVPLYLHALLVPLLVGTAAMRVHQSANGAAPLGFAGLVGVAVTLAWLGVLPGVPVLHELLHRQGWFPRALVFVLGVVIADPLRRLAHLRGHHVKLGLPEDSDTARRGETIYHFIFRAALGGTLEGYYSEKDRLAKRGRSVWSLHSDVVASLAWTVAATS
jgi:alkane 1-monooxygenase